jgi:hypothetical protein
MALFANNAVSVSGYPELGDYTLFLLLNFDELIDPVFSSDLRFLMLKSPILNIYGFALGLSLIILEISFWPN